MMQWKGKNEFALTQVKVAFILAVAYFGDRWEPSYPRNENHNMNLFWIGHAVLLIAAFATWKHNPREGNSTRVTLLSREQTEEWKGWMQFAFIFYHYYRAWSAYNWIRVFVSSYVWMTGFGNFLYFDRKKDFSIQRVVSMWIRINYFPIVLSWATGVSLDLYYVVPLHTEGFFMTLITCYLAVQLEEKYGLTYWNSRAIAIAFSLMVHIAFFETPAVNVLKVFSDEIHFRFQADKYSAWIGILSGACMGKASEYMSWAYGRTHNVMVAWAQRVCGVGLIYFWYYKFGQLEDKYEYNAFHPYVFILATVGWLMLRNSSKYLTESHSVFLEFLGRNTLETYVLQFHLFMNHQVQHIPIVIPGSGPDGFIGSKVLNMMLCGIIFVALAVQARKVTVSTQMTVVELVDLKLKNMNKEVVETRESDSTLEMETMLDKKTSDIA